MGYETTLTKQRAVQAATFTRSDGDQRRVAASREPAPTAIGRIRNFLAKVFHHEGDTFDGGS